MDRAQVILCVTSFYKLLINNFLNKSDYKIYFYKLRVLNYEYNNNK